MSANPHLMHFEDLLFEPGGIRKILSVLKNEKPLSVSLKYDGSPALVFGQTKEGKNFVTLKNWFFKKEPVLFTDIVQFEDYDDTPLIELLYDILPVFQKIKYFNQEEQAYLGDFLYRKSDLRIQDINNVSYVTFTPNSLTYAIPVGKQSLDIMDAKIGLAYHTRLIKDVSGQYHFDVPHFGWRWSPTAEIYQPRTEVTYLPQDFMVSKVELNIFQRYIDSTCFSDNMTPTWREILRGAMHDLYLAGDKVNAVPPSILYASVHAKISETAKKKMWKKETVEGYFKFLEDYRLAFFQVFLIYQVITDVKEFIINNFVASQPLYTFYKGKAVGNEGIVCITESGTRFKMVNRSEFTKNLFDSRKDNYEQPNSGSDVR